MGVLDSGGALVETQEVAGPVERIAEWGIVISRSGLGG